MEGPLSKWTNVMKGWQFRWFVLDDNAGLLSYYTSKDKMVRGARRGCVRLKGAVVGIDDEDDSTFTITVDGKQFHFQARDTDERERWLRALEDTILRHTNSNLYGYKWAHARHPPSIKDFDKKLTESDAYLQILIEQVKDLESKIENITEEKEKAQMSLVLERANTLLETIKHSIVLLQIAKNTTHHTDSILRPQITLQDNNVNLNLSSNNIPIDKEANSDELSDTLPETKSMISPDLSPRSGSNEEAITPGDQKQNAGTPRHGDVPANLNMVERGIKTAQDNSNYLGKHPRELTLASNIGHLISSSSAPLNLIVPETSYSSSDDEDFYDATEEVMASAVQSPSNPRIFEGAIEALEAGEEPKIPNPFAADHPHANFLNEDNSINFDAIYEDEEEELGSLEGQGSVISHLLSQVKIGMDLTKVVLPTFILEKRSLLEMYADFFAHPDIFVSIPDFESPRDRMIQVVKWYLSAFHAGRKSSVAKKPFNPILGEIFRCHWDIEGRDPVNEQVESGPIPWCDRNQLAFIAEQVSHHPPISAFYAEHFEQGISLCAHIWTKSKFLGLSIGVHNIGQGCVSVTKYDEEYIITFPNGYGRSILTVPWIELGGEVNITCSKTGYFANVEFQTKPFYGGKKHRVSADIFQPGEKKSFVNISGEWNGKMNAKWTNGKTELFVDTQDIPIIKKKVRPIADQESFESRKLWKEVSAALKFRNVQVATESKFVLEQKQREEARIRKETNGKWETRVFHEVGEHWLYDSPLQKRLKNNDSSESSISPTPSSTAN